MFDSADQRRRRRRRRSIAIRPKASFVLATFPANFSLSHHSPANVELARSRRRSRKFRTAVVVGHDKPPSGRDDPEPSKGTCQTRSQVAAIYRLRSCRRNITGPGSLLLRCLLFGPLVCTQSAEVASKRKGSAAHPSPTPAVAVPEPFNLLRTPKSSAERS